MPGITYKKGMSYIVLCYGRYVYFYGVHPWEEISGNHLRIFFVLNPTRKVKEEINDDNQMGMTENILKLTRIDKFPVPF